MRRTLAIGCWVVLAGLAWFPGVLAAQQATVQTPLHTVGDSFYERIGLQWGLNFPGGFARFGGPSVGVPPFGRFDPNAGLNFGLGFRGGNVNGFLNGAFAQGFQRSFVTQAPVLTLTNGVPGYVGDASISPFVVGSIPVVGGAPVFSNPRLPTYSSGVGSDAVRQALQSVRSGQPSGPVGQVANLPHQERQVGNLPHQQPQVGNLPHQEPQVGNLPHQEPQVGNLPHQEPTAAPAKVPEDSSAERLAAAQASSAGQAAMSVAEARRLHAAELEAAQQEAQRYWQKGLAAEKEGSLASARIYYRLAAKRATGEFQKRILDRLETLKKPPAREDP